MVRIPKRNKSKDNPYILDFDEQENKYIVKFADNKRVINRVEVSEEVYKAFDSFELEDISQIHKYRAHIEHNEVYPNKIVDETFSVEEIVEDKLLANELKDAINLLTETQRRRIKMYYFEDMNLREIAEIEKCSIMSIKESIDSGIEKMRKILKK